MNSFVKWTKKILVIFLVQAQACRCQIILKFSTWALVKFGRGTNSGWGLRNLFWVTFWMVSKCCFKIRLSWKKRFGSKIWVPTLEKNLIPLSANYLAMGGKTEEGGNQAKNLGSALRFSLPPGRELEGKWHLGGFFLESKELGFYPLKLASYWL